MDRNREFMVLATELARRSVPETDKPNPPPKVGAVLVKDGALLETAYRGETGAGHHAEYALLEKKLYKADLKGTTLYTTLEPCTVRGSGKIPCVTRIIERGIKHVVIGMIDPNRTIQGDGYWLLHQNEIETSFFDDDLMRQIKQDNQEFIEHYRPLRWLPPVEIRNLDDWYFIINAIYLDRNLDRTPAWLFAHLVEVIGALSSLTTDKIKSGVSFESFLPKCLAWWFALCGAAGLRSVEQLVWRKFPAVCTYCQKKLHDTRVCTEFKKKNRNPDWRALARLSEANSDQHPGTINGWKELFYNIYPTSQGEDYPVVFGRLCEELGELAECVRAFDVIPTTFLSESADVFAWLMHLTNLYEYKESVNIDISSLLYERYPDRCRDCNSPVCICPPHLPSTLRRIAHEGPPPEVLSGSNPFLTVPERMDRFNIGSDTILVNDIGLKASPSLIEDTYGIVRHIQRAIRVKRELPKQLCEQLDGWCTSMLGLAASQRINQRLIDEFVLNARSADTKTKNLLTQLIEAGPKCQIRDAFLASIEQSVA